MRKCPATAHECERGCGRTDRSVTEEGPTIHGPWCRRSPLTTRGLWSQDWASVATDDHPLPQFVLRASTKIAPDDLNEKFCLLRSHKQKFWEALLSYYVLIPVLIEQFRKECTPTDGVGPKLSAKQIHKMAEQRRVLLGSTEKILGAYEDLRHGITKLQTASEKTIAAEAPKLAMRFAQWDQDRQHAESWIRDLDRVRAGHGPELLLEVIRKTKTSLRKGSPVFHRQLDLAHRHARAYEDLHDEIVVANMRLVSATVRRAVYRYTSAEDLASEGAIGLMKAVHRFDLTRGLRFATYAVYWIRHYVMRTQQSDDLIRLPIHVQEKCNRINRTRRRFYTDNGVEPTMSQLLEIVNDDVAAKNILNEEQVIMLDRRPSGMYSMQHPVGLFEDDDSILQDLIPDRSEPVDELLDMHEIRELVEASLAQMAPAQADAFRQVSGLSEDQSLGIVGQRHRLSRERIRQLSLQAADEIRRTLKRRRVHFCLGNGGGVGVGTGGGREIGGP